MSSGYDEDPHTYVHLTFQNTTRGTKTWPCPPHWIILEAYWYLKVYITHTPSSVSVLFRGLKEGPVFSFHIHKSFIHLTTSVFRKSALVFILRFQMYFPIHITVVILLPVTLSQLSAWREWHIYERFSLSSYSFVFLRLWLSNTIK